MSLYTLKTDSSFSPILASLTVKLSISGHSCSQLRTITATTGFGCSSYFGFLSRSPDRSFSDSLQLRLDWNVKQERPERSERKMCNLQLLLLNKAMLRYLSGTDSPRHSSPWLLGRPQLSVTSKGANLN